MEAVVRRVLHVIQDCVRHANITDLNDVDRICLNLARCSAELGDLLNCVLDNSERLRAYPRADQRYIRGTVCDRRGGSRANIIW